MQNPIRIFNPHKVNILQFKLYFKDLLFDLMQVVDNCKLKNSIKRVYQAHIKFEESVLDLCLDLRHLSVKEQMSYIFKKLKGSPTGFIELNDNLVNIIGESTALSLSDELKVLAKSAKTHSQYIQAINDFVTQDKMDNFLNWYNYSISMCQLLRTSNEYLSNDAKESHPDPLGDKIEANRKSAWTAYPYKLNFFTRSIFRLASQNTLKPHNKQIIDLYELQKYNYDSSTSEEEEISASEEYDDSFRPPSV